MYNPQYPHTLYVQRAEKDANGDTVFDEEGNPSYSTLALAKVAMLDDEPLMASDGSFLTENVTELHYGYRSHSQSVRTTGEVEVADFVISVEMFTTALESGDRLFLTDYDRTYQGSVIKKVTYNQHSKIWFNEVRN